MENDEKNSSFGYFREVTVLSFETFLKMISLCIIAVIIV